MKIFLAGSGDVSIKANFFDFYRLESFFYITEKDKALIHKYKDFLLDSGAFTFMNNSKNSTDWDEYVERYAAFVNKHDIKHFFELDIDVIVGINEVERLRAKLEKFTNKQSIPVWHKSRGKDYWLRIVKEYNYVAIGGIVTKEIKPSEYKYFTWLLNEAKKENCKVHGLGFTSLKGLKKYSFYSVDSTTWLSGAKFGEIHSFDGRTIERNRPKEGYRAKSDKTTNHNFYEWIKFCKYAEHNL